MDEEYRIDDLAADEDASSLLGDMLDDDDDADGPGIDPGVYIDSGEDTVTYTELAELAMIHETNDEFSEFGDPSDLYDEDDYADIPEDGADEIMVVYSEWEPGELITGRYEVRDKHEGGTGPVYVVYHRAWRRLLVAKTPGPEMLAEADAVNRITANAELWAELGPHPNIATCHYVQEVRGLPLIFIDHVNGEGLDRRMETLREGGWASVLDAAIQLCEAMEYAHGRGLVHGNLKPSNCLVDRDGILKVTDFGMFRGAGIDAVFAASGESADEEDEWPELSEFIEEAEQGESASDGMLYAAPEVWRSGESGGEPSDIYSFGALMYEMVCGRPPFVQGQGEDRDGLEKRILNDDPQPPAECREDVPAEMSAFITKCLVKEPEGRFPGFKKAVQFLKTIYGRIEGADYPRPPASGMVKEADALNDRGVAMYDLGLEEKAYEKFSAALRRDPSHAAAIFNRGWMDVERKKTDFVEVKESLETAMAETMEKDYCDCLLADLAIKCGDLEEARVRLERAGGTMPVSDKLGLVLAGMGEWEKAKEQLSEAMGAAPEEEKLAAMEKCRIEIGDSPGEDGDVIPPDRHADLEDSYRKTRLPWIRLVNTINGHAPGVKALSMTMGGVFAITGGRDGRLRVWDTTTGECLRDFVGLDAECITADPAGSFFIVGGGYGEVAKYDLQSKERISLMQGHEAWVTSVTLAPGGRLAVTGSQDGTVRIWDHSGGECMKVMREHESGVRAAAVSPDGRYIVSGGDDARAIMWESATGKAFMELEKHVSPIWHVSITRNGAFVITISEDGMLCIWDLETAQLIRTHRGMEIGAAAVYPGGRYLVTGGGDATVGIWDLNEKQRIRILEGHADSVGCVAVSERGGFILSAGYDGLIKKWDISDIGRLEYVRFTPQLSPRPDAAGAMNRMGDFRDRLRKAEMLMEAGDFESATDAINKAAQVPGHERDADLRELRRKFAGEFSASGCSGVWRMCDFSSDAGRVLAVDISSVGRIAAAGTREGSVSLWDTATGECRKSIQAHEGYVNKVCLSGDGKKLLTCGADGALAVWNPETGDRISIVRGEKKITALSVTPDARYAVTGNRDGDVAITDLEAGGDSSDAGSVLEGHEGEVTCVAVSPDMTYFVTASADATLRVWELPSGRCVRVLEGHEESVKCAAVSRDGRFIASGAGGFSHADTSIKIWNAKTGECVCSLPGHDAEVSGLGFSPDGKYIVSAGFDKKIRVWNIAAGEQVESADSHSDEIQDFAISADAMTALTCSWEETFTAWALDWDYDTNIPLK